MRALMLHTDEFESKIVEKSTRPETIVSEEDKEGTRKMYEELIKKFNNSEYTVETSHFGYHKSLLLKIKGHPGSFRYREF